MFWVIFDEMLIKIRQTDHVRQPRHNAEQVPRQPSILKGTNMQHSGHMGQNISN